MGNICCTPAGQGNRAPTPDSFKKPTQERNTNNADIFDTNDFIKQMKAYHLDRLKTELENDPYQFILDNLLMCVQFFDSFEKAVEIAKEYKRNAEREMTELLAKDPHEGMILGDRRVKLLTGMSHVLAQNFIYCGKNQSDEDDEVDLLYGGSGLKDTFMTEGILPLEFILSWDNIEVYDSNDLEDVKHYSDAKGASPTVRVCMEQPDKKIEYPKGYVRLRFDDDLIARRKQLKTPSLPPNSDSEFPHEPVYNKPYSDGVSEANSESESTAPGSTSEDDSPTKLASILKDLPTGKMLPLSHEPIPSTSKSARQAFADAGASSPFLSKLTIPPHLRDNNEAQPSLVVHVATPPVHNSQFQSKIFESGFLFPQTKPNKMLYLQSRSTPNLSTTPDQDSPGKETSSGYDTTSTMSRSRSSSMVSEMLRDGWQKKNIKKLWEYGKKTRKDQIPTGERYDPIPADCYSEIKVEYQYDLFEEDDDDDDKDEDSNSEEGDDDQEIDFSTGRLKKKSKTRNYTEDEYQLRFYLNSLQFSSNACSEFHYIGPSLSIPEASLESGVVVGTTIRCPIPYTYPKENENEDDAKVGSYHVTYSFTPAIHIKSWPKSLYVQFIHQALHRKTQGEVWPSPVQIEKIETSGCNAIPLGYRSVAFFNAEQILEWELNFQECEMNLLDSFHGSHWRAYIFASILMRAFIAPLGPLGIGLEHIRNILYYMCNEDFYGWNDEQPGLHLSKLLGRLFDCLSKGYMSGFFVRSRNLLQSIPQHNLRFVQAHIKQICENIIVYCIYAFRNLIYIKKAEAFPLPDFTILYDILTGTHGKLLEIMNPILRLQKIREDEQKQELNRQRTRSRKKKQQKQSNLIAQQDEIDRNFFATRREPQKRDKFQSKLKKEYEKRMEEQRRKNRETRKLQQDPEHRLPDAERRPSIDLKKSPVIQSQFSKMRRLLMIQFFIEHFIKMAKKATDLANYGQATMYVLQVENLCEIVKDENYRDTSPVITDENLNTYRSETLRLWDIIGEDKDQYILARLLSIQSSSRHSQLSPARSASDFTTASGLPSFTNNWDLRKLPTPPASEKGTIPTGKIFEKPNIASSLQSFEHTSNTRMSSEVLPHAPASPRPLPSEKIKPRRQESLKFVIAALPKDAAPPPTPPRSHSRPPSRQSTIDLILESDVGEAESTDL